MTRVRTYLLAAAAAWSGSTMAAMAQGARPRYTEWWLPARATATAGRIDDIFYLILWLTLTVLALVLIVLVTFLVKYRHRDGARARHSHGNPRLELVWTAIPALILIFLAVVSYRVWSDITDGAPSEEASLVIDVAPRQFQWDVRYAGRDGLFNTPDDILTYDDVHVPVGTDVVIRLRAQDVIHSFFVPEFRIKQDAVPGMTTKVWFNVPEPGVFEIACAELCGAGHYRMRGKLTVHSKQEYERWHEEQAAKFAAAAAAAAPAARDTSVKDTSVKDTSGAGRRSQEHVRDAGAIERRPNQSSSIGWNRRNR